MRPFRLLSACLALGFLSGCAGYRLGPTNGVEAGAKTLELSPFSNQTLEPGLGDAVTTAMRRHLQSDSTFRLASGGGADVIVSGVLTKYTRHELSFVPQDVLTVRDYRITATAQITARDVSTGRILLDSPVSGYALVRVGSDLTSAQRQALPLLADDLARKATALLVDGNW
jgi:hypothetical protein